MSNYGLTNYGVNIKRLDTILDEMHTDLTEKWGINTQQNPNSLLNAKEFNLDDFSRDHLFYEDDVVWGDTMTCGTLSHIIKVLNEYRNKYLKCKDGDQKKRFWWQLIQLLPSSYDQRSTVLLNYAVLRNMYHARKAHKLDEWHEFCAWIEQLPYSELITMKGGQTNE